MFDLLVLHYFKVLSTDLAVDGVAEVLLGCLKEGSKAEQAKGDLSFVGFCLLVSNFLQ